MSHLLDAALSYAAGGFAVVPLYWPTGPGACSCGCRHPHCWQRAKHPLVARGEASTDAGLIRDWWRRWPLANVGIAPRQSDLVIVDLDFRPNRGELLQGFLDRWGENADDTVIAITGTGYHLYYRRPPGGPELFGGKDRLGGGRDVFVDRYVVGPPSLHHNLNTYRWRDGHGLTERAPAMLPDSIAAELARRPRWRWYARIAPFYVADALRLPLGVRQWLRGLARRAGIGA